MIEIKKMNDGKLALFAPYNAAALPDLRNAGGKWDASLKAWIFPPEAKSALDGVIQKHYGVSPNAKGVQARIRTKRFVSEYRDSIRFGGVVIAQAFGRDSGARVGNGVILKSGKIGSGGSVKNWRTTIDEESVFLVSKFPAGIESNDDFDIEYIEPVEKKKCARNDTLARFSDDEILAEAKARNLV